MNLDREQFQRVVVNLVDNAAEAMQDSLVKTLYIATQPGAAETVELVDRRFRLRRQPRRQGEAVPALFFDQEPRHRPGAGDRQPHRGRAQRDHPRGGQPAGGRALHRRDSGRAGDDAERQRLRDAAGRPSVKV